jgi:hypothetical protein
MTFKLPGKQHFQIFKLKIKLKMLQPKRSKHRKQQKGRIREVAKRGTSISFGSYALKALSRYG